MKKYLYTVELINDPLAEALEFTDTEENLVELHYGRSGNVTITIKKIHPKFSVAPEFEKSVTWAAGTWRNVSQETIV